MCMIPLVFAVLNNLLAVLQTDEYPVKAFLVCMALLLVF